MSSPAQSGRPRPVWSTPRSIRHLQPHPAPVRHHAFKFRTPTQVNVKCRKARSRPAARRRSAKVIDGAHEKCGVGGQIGYFRRNHLVPRPRRVLGRPHATNGSATSGSWSPNVPAGPLREAGGVCHRCSPAGRLCSAGEHRLRRPVEVAFAPSDQRGLPTKPNRAAVQVDLRDPPLSMSPKWCLVSVAEGGRYLCGVDRTSFRKVRFIALSPGPYSLHLEVIRSRARRSTRVQREVVLCQRDILLVTCDPVQPNVFYRRGPAMDTWSAQILQQH